MSSQIVSLLRGEALTDGKEVDTVDGIGNVNGRQILAGTEQLHSLQQHIESYESSATDLRDPIRNVEQRLLTEYAGFLIGNQCVDFQKQDGVTEIEEAIMANTVERRLNDLLLQDEAAGKLVVNRQPIFVCAVSNFTNFLDLSRKTLRSLELGIPVVILGRTQISQHSFRWAELLVQLLSDQADVDPGMVTFASCDLEGISEMTKTQAMGNLYVTSSRELAANIKIAYPKTIASTGGPNTLVSTEWTDDIKDAVATSAAIECAGQCTALRHCVVPSNVANETISSTFDGMQSIERAEDAMKEGVFAGVFVGHNATSEPPDIPKHASADAFLQVRDGQLPEADINEYWRKVVVDFTKLDLVDSGAPRRPLQNDRLQHLAEWLNTNQPITLAVNGPRREALKLGIRLWEETGLVVNTIGSTDDASMPPALTCQARPQEGEVFGEFPPRATMDRYSVYPVIVPSSNPSYDASYTKPHLESKGSVLLDTSIPSTTRTLLTAVQDVAVRGYCVLLLEYLQNVCRMNPKRGFGNSRTALFGLQRPPLSCKTILRVSKDADWDVVAPLYLLFFVTNARDQVVLSVDPANSEVLALSDMLTNVVVESQDEYKTRISDRTLIFDAIQPAPLSSFPMVGNFVSLYLPMGHIKSTKAEDDEFVLNARVSQKWLTTLF